MRLIEENLKVRENKKKTNYMQPNNDKRVLKFQMQFTMSFYPAKQMALKVRNLFVKED